MGNAKLTIAEQNTVVSCSGQTNESGDYTFPDLPLGQYTVTARVTGLNAEIRHISLSVKTSTCIDFHLQPGDVTESAEVTGAAPLLETDLADTGAKIEQVQTAALPLGTQRNFKGLLNLGAGTAHTVDEVAPDGSPKRTGSGAVWFNPARFASPAPLTFGNTGINIFDGRATSIWTSRS